MRPEKLTSHALGSVAESRRGSRFLDDQERISDKARLVTPVRYAAKSFLRIQMEFGAEYVVARPNAERKQEKATKVIKAQAGAVARKHQPAKFVEEPFRNTLPPPQFIALEAAMQLRSVSRSGLPPQTGGKGDAYHIGNGLGQPLNSDYGECPCSGGTSSVARFARMGKRRSYTSTT